MSSSIQAPLTNPPLPPIHDTQPASPPKTSLKSWWKHLRETTIKTSAEQQDLADQPSGIFGIPLRESITYANVAISLVDADGKSYIYGYVPIVVAKCGVYLKEKAINVEGIFRLSGSEKRIKELKNIFDSPDRYGKGLDWAGYTVHDAANVLRRYLNQLPEPIVPLDLYYRFREPLMGHIIETRADGDPPLLDKTFDDSAAISTYQKLITEMPPLNRQLLLYILDLLAVFAGNSMANRMNAQNLSAIFQPGILSHPVHDMAPQEYRLSQDVLIFLIENQDHFLIGMQGTAADEKTVQEVNNGGIPSPQKIAQEIDTSGIPSPENNVQETDTSDVPLTEKAVERAKDDGALSPKKNAERANDVRVPSPELSSTSRMSIERSISDPSTSTHVPSECDHAQHNATVAISDQNV
ncbi:hypothetical protein K3495_g992 [Podosphaera aphanis]|nr:hypothetical protein K3495_g992 [Podosphaera aphanis]